jgi:RNA polymerase primary sigma factor
MVSEVEPGMRAYIEELNKKKYDPLTKKEERRLLKKYKTNHDLNARNKLVNSNLRYTCSLVNSYIGRGMSYSELLSEANNGLIESIDKFDTKYDIKLLSYSKWWILQRIQAALEKKNKIKTGELPTESYGEESTFTDDEALASGNDEIMPKEFEYEDDEINEEADRTLFINTLLNILSEREATVIRMYFGIDYNDSYTLTDIGKHFNLSKERIRQVLETALRKIRSEAILLDDAFFNSL